MTNTGRRASTIPGVQPLDRTPNEMPTEGGAVVEYEIDHHDFIVATDAGWDLFAKANHAAHLVAPAALGRSLWDFLGGGTTPALYRDILRRVRDGRTVVLPFRCDSEHNRRDMRMTIAPLAQGRIRFRSETIDEAPAPSPLWDTSLLRSSERLMVCSWCKLVNVDSVWVLSEQAVCRLGIFSRQRPPSLTHGICPDCHRAVSGVL